MDGDPRSLKKGGDGLERSSILADLRNRRILATLQSAGPMPVDELRRRLAVAEGDGSTAGRGAIRTDLRHRCLPGLEAVGWIERGPEGVRLDEPLFETIDVSPPVLGVPDDPAWDVVSAVVARPYRQAILSVVAAADALTVGDLAAELRERDGGAWTGQFDGDRTLVLTLHHVDVPKLAATGVIEYDPEGKTVDATSRLRPCLDRLNIESG